MLENGSILSYENSQYRVIETLGWGANTIAYLAQCHSRELTYKCILKEYAPQNNDDFDTAKQRFIEGGKTQNNIRQFCENGKENLSPLEMDFYVWKEEKEKKKRSAK